MPSKFYMKVRDNCRVDNTTNPVSVSSMTSYTQEDLDEAPRGVGNPIAWLCAEAEAACADACGHMCTTHAEAKTDNAIDIKSGAKGHVSVMTVPHERPGEIDVVNAPTSGCANEP